MSDAAFYTATEDGGFAPTGLGLSPWAAEAQNGVALAGLVAHVLDRVPSAAAMTPARLTIDILGQVPMARLAAVTRIVRDGRRLQLVEAELVADGRPRVRATVLRVRTAATPDFPVAPTRPFPADAAPAFGNEWCDSLRVEGDFREPGPGAMWVRSTLPVVAGSPLSPLERVAMAADFGTGAGPLLAMRDWTYANVDISIHLTRLPRGEWLLIDAHGESAGNGMGVTHSRIGDREGMIGMAHQTMFLEPRARASQGRRDEKALDPDRGRMPREDEAALS